MPPLTFWPGNIGMNKDLCARITIRAICTAATPFPTNRTTNGRYCGNLLNLSNIAIAIVIIIVPVTILYNFISPFTADTACLSRVSSSTNIIDDRSSSIFGSKLSSSDNIESKLFFILFNRRNVWKRLWSYLSVGSFQFNFLTIFQLKTSIT